MKLINDESLTMFLDEINQYPLLTNEEKEKLWPRIKEGDKDAIDTMVLSNMRLVIKIAKEYLESGIPFLDLIQEGSIGLQTAVKRFDASLGYQFSTYAAFWIRQQINKMVMNDSRLVRLPVNVINDMTKLNKLKQEFIDEHHRKPNFDELLEMTNMSAAKLRDVLNVQQGILSLDQLVKPTDEDSSTLFELVSDDTIVSPENQNWNLERRDAILSVLDTLTEREKSILMKRFGFDDGIQKSLEQVGDMMGLTRERVRQLEIGALAKLRNPIRAKILSEYM
jgi:RNA polymerase primary sigma factor